MLLLASYIDNMRNISSTSYILLRRVAAFLYDCLLLVAIFFVVTAIAITFNDGQAIQFFGYKLLLYVIGFLFFDWFWMHGGQTLGMRAWKIKLSSTNNASLTHVQCLQRYLLGTLCFAITLLWMFFREDGAALHDHFSNTKIVIIIS